MTDTARAFRAYGVDFPEGICGIFPNCAYAPKEKAGEANRTGFISLTVIGSPACTVESFYH